MIEKNYSNKIPSFRHRNWISFFDKSFFDIQKKKYIKFLKKKTLIKRKISFNPFNKIRSVTFDYKKQKKQNMLITKYFYDVKPFKFFLEGKLFCGVRCFIPGIDSTYIGSILNNFKIDLIKFNFNGMLCFLDEIPFGCKTCFIMNYNNSKFTYAKSSGSYCLKVRALKREKLIKIVLPSNIIIFLPKNCNCFLGECLDFDVEKYKQGKWGFSIKKNKNLHVRGVAKNPVDHPNGGRTKSCKPEKSPWGWIAKQNK